MALALAAVLVVLEGSVSAFHAAVACSQVMYAVP